MITEIFPAFRNVLFLRSLGGEGGAQKDLDGY